MRQIGERIHVHEQPFRLYGMEIGTRMTVVELEDGLWLHSPVKLDDAVAKEIEKLGKVAHLVAPSAVHHLFIGQWKQRFPGARMYGPPKLARKRPDLAFDELLTNDPPAAWRGAINLHSIEGAPFLREFAFLHRASRTLILTDHLMHVGEGWPLATRIGARLMGAYKRAAWPRDFGLIMKDRSACRASLAPVLDWDFDRIVISHGDIVERDGKQALRRAYAL